MSDSASRWAPRCAEPRNAWPSTPSSVRTVSRPSWLFPLNRPVCRPYVVAGISVQANRVSVTSVIFTGRPPFDSSIHKRASAGGTQPRDALRRAHRSAPRQVGPQRIGAALGDHASKLDRPVAFAAELGAPRPEAPRHELQRVLVREADGAVGLMGDRRAHTGRLADPYLGGGDLERSVATVGGAEGVGRRRAGRSRVSGQGRQV